jgi:hypothetical protein
MLLQHYNISHASFWRVGKDALPDDKAKNDTKQRKKSFTETVQQLEGNLSTSPVKAHILSMTDTPGSTKPRPYIEITCASVEKGQYTLADDTLKVRICSSSYLTYSCGSHGSIWSITMC